MEKRLMKHTDISAVTFRMIPLMVVREMAKHLDIQSNANWAALADWHHFSSLDIEHFKSRACYSPSASPTMVFFDDYYLTRDISVDCLISGLEYIGNLACKNVLCAWLESFMKEPLNTGSCERHVRSPASSHRKIDSGINSPASNDGLLWRRVADIGNWNTQDGAASMPLNIPRQTTPDSHRSIRVLPDRSLTLTDSQHAVDYTTTNNCSQGLDLRSMSRLEDSPRILPRVGNCPVDMLTDDRNDTKPHLLLGSSCAAEIPDSDKTQYVAKWCEDQREFTESIAVNREVKYRDQKNCKPSAREKMIKRITHPFTKKDKKKLDEINGQICSEPTRITLSDMQHSPFVLDNRQVRVFVTYTYDNKQHMKTVLQVCDCLKKNKFSVGLDAREEHLLREDGEKIRWHDMRYDRADYVLVLVSPLYYRVVTGKTSPEDGGANVLHARHIHDRMYMEYMTSASNGHALTRRFVPIVMSGASAFDVPDWLRKSQVFTWPQQFEHLMFYLIQPAQVIANYVSKWDRGFPSRKR